MSNSSETYLKLSKIIDKTVAEPTIVNDNSKYVVVTYWWGRGNLNGNTARPCVSFFEPMLRQITGITNSLLNSATTQGVFNWFVKNLETAAYQSTAFEKYTTNQAKMYLDYVKKMIDIQEGQTTLGRIEKLKEKGVIPQTYEHNDLEHVKSMFKVAGLLFLINAKNILLKIYSVKKRVDLIKEKIINSTKEENEKEREKLIKKRDELYDELNKLKAELKVIMNKKHTYDTETLNNAIKVIHNDELTGGKKSGNTIVGEASVIDDNTVEGQPAIVGYSDEVDINDIMLVDDETQEKNNKEIRLYLDDFQGKSIYDVLNTTFRYLAPIKFETMIAHWENKCREAGCNFMAVEYPEFAQPGGYQMAINAKPLFIRKALELCPGRGVLYIDGDMTINKYPTIFDMDDIDFMARGWHIDPRSSWKIDESIMIDPYVFETSGGTMFFGQSNASKALIEKWIEQSATKKNAGKADDRILSLVFNAYHFLLSLKFIQLPIEYLWLTMDFDDRMMEHVYDYDKKAMDKTVFIEHPECLTTEDTAVDAGASSDRQPSYYSFLEYPMPTSEEYFEYLMFDKKEDTAAFRDYYNYMSDLQYIDDGNEDLYKKKLIFTDPETKEVIAEQPMYITNYDKKYGKRYNGIYEENMKLMETAGEAEIDGGYKVVTTDNIPLILKCLQSGHDVIYFPEDGIINENIDFKMKTEERKRRKAMMKSDFKEGSKYKHASLAFLPYQHNEKRFANVSIHLDLPVLIRAGDRRLFQFLAIHRSLQDFSDKLAHGAYQFLSLVRVQFCKRDTAAERRLAREEATKGKQVMTGGRRNINNMFKLYYEGVDAIYRMDNRKTHKNIYRNRKTHKRGYYGKKTARNHKLHRATRRA